MTVNGRRFLYYFLLKRKALTKQHRRNSTTVENNVEKHERETGNRYKNHSFFLNKTVAGLLFHGNEICNYFELILLISIPLD